MDSVKDFVNLGPALGSVVVLGVVCWRLLLILDRHSQTLSEIGQHVAKSNSVLDSLSLAVRQNTNTTEYLTNLITKK